MRNLKTKKGQKRNRELTDKDILGAKSICITTVADENFPFYHTIRKEDFKSIDNDNTRRITNWCFEVEGILDDKEVEQKVYDLSEFNGEITDYHIEIGSLADD